MKKLWRRLRIFGIAIGILAALYLVGNALLIWITGSRLEAKLKALRDAGEPISLHDLARDPIAPERNAAVFLRRAAADIEAFSNELASVPPEPSEADRKVIRVALGKYPRLFTLLEQAANCPDYNSDLDYTAGTDNFLNALINHLQKFRAAVYFLDERTRIQVADKKRDEALHDSVLILRLSGHLEREPMVISHLVVCACRAIGVQAANRVLRSGPVSARGRAELEAELERTDSPKAFEQSLKTERAFGSEYFRTNPCLAWWNKAYFNDDQCYHLDLLAEFIQMAPRTYADVRPMHEKFQGEFKSWRHRLSNLLLPALAKTQEADLRTRALVRCLRVLNALQKKAASATAAQPKLDKLGLPAEATMDPFTGSVLHIRKLSGEWLIYSDGSNLADDGGELANWKDVGLGPVPTGKR